MRFRLTRAAYADFLGILDYTDDTFGPAAMAQLRARLESAFERINDGIALGHVRSDVPKELGLRFVVERPFVIAFDPHDREIKRIVHGA